MKMFEICCDWKYTKNGIGATQLWKTKSKILRELLKTELIK